MAIVFNSILREYLETFLRKDRAYGYVHSSLFTNKLTLIDTFGWTKLTNTSVYSKRSLTAHGRGGVD